MLEELFTQLERHDREFGRQKKSSLSSDFKKLMAKELKINGYDKATDEIYFKIKLLKEFTELTEKFFNQFITKNILADETKVEDYTTYSIADLVKLTGRNLRTFMRLIDEKLLIAEKNDLNRIVITSNNWNRFLKENPEYRNKKEIRPKLKR